MSEPAGARRRQEGYRVRCPLGGTAPCVDDLCHGSDHTLCGLERGYDFCEHGYEPDSCAECNADRWDDDDWDDASEAIASETSDPRE